jgi:uncharacterized protein YutE (UPF0331/DUF86 family)
VSPPKLDSSIVFARLESIRELLDDLESIDSTVLREDRLTRHAVERILTQLVELAASINSYVVGAKFGRGPRSYKESFELAAECGLIPAELATELVPSVGMRNLLVHEYLEIDLGKVAAAVPLAQAGYRRYVAVVAAFVTRS